MSRPVVAADGIAEFLVGARCPGCFAEHRSRRRRPRPLPRPRRRRCINSRGHGIVSGIPYRLERGHGPFGMREHRLVARQGWLFLPSPTCIRQKCCLSFPPSLYEEIDNGRGSA